MKSPCTIQTDSYVFVRTSDELRVYATSVDARDPRVTWLAVIIAGMATTVPIRTVGFDTVQRNWGAEDRAVLYQDTPSPEKDTPTE